MVNKSRLYGYLISVLICLVLFSMMNFALGVAVYGCDPYYMDSPCFDMNYRCEVECSRYDRNFTGEIDGCSCDCGDGWVSSCSGFFYAKDDSYTIVRIPEETVVIEENETEIPWEEAHPDIPSGEYVINRSGGL